MRNAKLQKDARRYLYTSLSSASSTVAVLLVTLCDPELLPATAELEPSPSFPPVELPKLQLDSKELGSAGFDVEAAMGLDIAGSSDDEGRSGEDTGRG
jgi:hypothetical protein